MYVVDVVVGIFRHERRRRFVEPPSEGIEPTFFGGVFFSQRKGREGGGGGKETRHFGSFHDTKARGGGEGRGG